MKSLDELDLEIAQLKAEIVALQTALAAHGIKVPPPNQLGSSVATLTTWG